MIAQNVPFKAPVGGLKRISGNAFVRAGSGAHDTQIAPEHGSFYINFSSKGQVRLQYGQVLRSRKVPLTCLLHKKRSFWTVVSLAGASLLLFVGRFASWKFFLGTQVLAYIAVISILWLPSSEEEEWNQEVIKQVLTSRAKKRTASGTREAQAADAGKGSISSGEKGNGSESSDNKSHVGSFVTDVAGSVIGDKIKMGASSIKCDIAEIDTAVHRWCDGDGKKCRYFVLSP